MSEKPQPNVTPLPTLADQIRARGGIIGDGKDGNGNPIPGEVLNFAPPTPDDDAPEPPPVAVGQVWRDHNDPARPLKITVLERLEATDTKPARWACRIADANTILGPADRTDSYFRLPCVTLHAAPLTLRTPDESSPHGLLLSTFAGVGRTAADLTNAGRALTNLSAHLSASMGGPPALANIAAQIRSIREAYDTAQMAVDLLAQAGDALVDWLIVQRPGALAGLLYVAEAAEPLTLADVAVHIDGLLQDAAPASTQDFMDALPHLAQMGLIHVEAQGDAPHGLTDVQIIGLPDLRDTLEGR